MASALASVQVDFNAIEAPGRPDTVQNDGIMGRDRKSGRDSTSDLADILIGRFRLENIFRLSSKHFLLPYIYRHSSKR